MTRLVHTMVEDTHDRDSIAGLPKIDNVLSDCPSTVGWPNCQAILRLQRRFGQPAKGSYDEVGVEMCLRQAPLLNRIVKNSIKVALRSRA